MSGNLAVGLWLILFGVLALVSTEVPKWVLGLTACIAGAVVLVGGGWWKRGP